MAPRERSPVWILLALAAVLVVAYAAVLLGGATFVGRDHLTHTLPAKQFLASSLRAGHLPGWWGAVDLGTPFLANPNHSALYPPAWLVAVLPVPWSIDVMLVAHVLFAGLGAAALSRRLGASTAGAIVAGGTFMLSGIVTSTVVHGGPLMTLAWLPWIAWAADRRSPLVLAMFVAMQLLAGDPSFAILGGLFAVGMVLARAPRRLPALLTVACAYAGALALAAVALAPAILLAGDSARAGGLSYDASVAWSLHPWRLLELVWPDVLGDANQPAANLARAVADSSGMLHLGPSWALGVYVSLPVLLLAGLGWARDRSRLAWLALAFALLALGGYTPLYRVYRAVFVPEWFVRYPEKYVAGGVLVACVLAGVGWTQIAAGAVSARALRGAAIAIAAFGALVGITAIARGALASAIDASALQPPLYVEAALSDAVSHGWIALAITCGVAVLLAIARTRGIPRLRALAIVLLFAHLATTAWHLLPTFDRAIVERAPAILSAVPPGRLAHPAEHLTRPGDPMSAQARTLYEGAAANMASPFGFSYVIGYDQAHRKEFERWMPTLAAAGLGGSDRFGAGYAVVPADEAAAAHVLGTDAPYGPYVLVERPGARPRAFVTTSWRWSTAEDPEHSSLLFSDPRTILLTGAGAASASPPSLTPCSLRSPTPDDVELTCEAPAAGYAVLLDSWGAGWSATVDGAPAPIEHADVLVRAVAVAAGHHVIVMSYQVLGLRAGALVSLLAWLALAALAIISRRGRAARPGSS